MPADYFKSRKNRFSLSSVDYKTWQSQQQRTELFFAIFMRKNLLRFSSFSAGSSVAYFSVWQFTLNQHRRCLLLEQWRISVANVVKVNNNGSVAVTRSTLGEQKISKLVFSFTKYCSATATRFWSYKGNVLMSYQIIFEPIRGLKYN